METKTSIVIPVYNKPDLLNNLLKGLIKHEKNSIDEVLVIDNASTEPMEDTFTFWVDSGELPLRILRNTENIGFTLSCNRGLKEIYRGIADPRSVFLISNDVTISGKFIAQAN